VFGGGTLGCYADEVVVPTSYVRALDPFYDQPPSVPFSPTCLSCNGCVCVKPPHCCRPQVAKVPSNMTLREAAGIFITFPTSYAGLVLRANLQAGETCLVHAGAGGVGIAAVQIAKALGATVVATAGSAEKLQVRTRRPTTRPVLRHCRVRALTRVLFALCLC